MNFETRHILRWGIPGWFFLINVIISILSIFGYEFVEHNFIIHSIIVTLAGVPLGYLIHQPYYLIANIFAKDNTVEWNLHLLTRSKEDRDFLNFRYGYLLTIIHGYGSLISSTMISMVTVLLIVYKNGTINATIWWLLLVDSALLVCLFINYIFSQKNFTRFVKKVLP